MEKGEMWTTKPDQLLCYEKFNNETDKSERLLAHDTNVQRKTLPVIVHHRQETAV